MTRQEDEPTYEPWIISAREYLLRFFFHGPGWQTDDDQEAGQTGQATRNALREWIVTRLLIEGEIQFSDLQHLLEEKELKKERLPGDS